MVEPVSLSIIIMLVVKNAPSWYKSLRDTLFTKGQEVALDKGKEFAVARGQGFVQRVFHLDEREQLHHLERALKTATERGLARFETLQERDQYKAIVDTLSQDGPMGETLRQEIMQLFTLAEQPDYAKLSETYNSRCRYYDPTHQAIDVGPYLDSFFNALLGELYADSYFRAQLSDVLQLRTAAAMQHSLLDIVAVLKNIYVTLEDKYTTEEFARDVAAYTTYIERSQRSLKIVGVVPKDLNADPELKGIFVPLRLAMRGQQTTGDEQQADAVVAALEDYPCLVLLGGPGSGKSTATKFLAWSHAACNQSTTDLASTLLLAGNPLPLRIELRRLNEERQRANYDFLSFASEVLLKRDGTTINPQMFRELLTRRCMLLLFDGLDEVTTLGQRLELVDEIEHFALTYPGNRVLVTSRPVGYELARISHPLFAHAEVQPFNDAQIQQYLENWYTAVLRLSPIPQREREEIDLLLSTLKANSRLHKLAENPLLLTVMTALHRYQRLPEKRVQVYEQCAQLLLETWAKIRETDKRWQDMEMVKDDQIACVAHLGFVLHERSQEEISGETLKEDTTVDVPSRFLYKHIEEFLESRNLFIELAKRRKEATRFIALIKEEAGLIVERGTDENNEPLYGFVHRTFQEYFAAADVYERYQQAEDPKIISIFLEEHLHDPHWREVISLLLGKLKSGPVTRLLRSILEGDLKSVRSVYTEIVQQDLFFVCDCLIEEIKVENALVELVVSRLSKLAKTGLFPSLRQEALEYLGELMQTRQYAEQGRKELVACATKEDMFDVATRFEAVQVLYLSSSNQSEDRQLANRLLTGLVQRPELTPDELRHTAGSLYRSSPAGSEAQQLATAMLTSLVQRPELTLDELLQTAESLYENSRRGSEAEQLASSLLTSLVERPELTPDQLRQTAESLYEYSPAGSETEQLAVALLTSLVERPELTPDQLRQTAVSLYQRSPGGSEARLFATTMLTRLVERPELTPDQLLQTAVPLYENSPRGSEAEQLASSLLMSLVERPELTPDQLLQTAVSLYRRRIGSKSRLFVTTMLTSFVERPELTPDELRRTAESLYRYSPKGSEAQQLASSLLMSLVERPELTPDQLLQTAVSLYRSSPAGSEAEQLASSLLISLVERPELTPDQLRRTAESLYLNSPAGSEAQQLASSLLISLVQRLELTPDQLLQTAESLYHPARSEAEQLAVALLTSLVQRPDLTPDQLLQTAESLHSYSSEGSEAKLLAASILLTLFSHAYKLENQGDFDVYNILRQMLPHYHKLPPITLPTLSASDSAREI